MHPKPPVTARYPETIIVDFASKSDESGKSLLITFRPIEDPVKFGGLRAFGE